MVFVLLFAGKGLNMHIVDCFNNYSSHMVAEGSFHYEMVFIKGEQVWRSGESAGLPPMWPGFDSRTRRSYVG